MDDRPHRTFELNIHVDGDTWEDVLRELQRITRNIEERGSGCTSVGGGYSTGHTVHIRHDPKMTGDQYWEDLEKHLAEKDVPRGKVQAPPKTTSCPNCTEGTLSTYDPEGAPPGTYPGLMGCSNCDGIFRIRGQK